MLSWEETEAYDQGVEASFIIHTFMTYLKTQDFYVNLSETKHVVRIHPWYETTPGCHVPRLKGSFPMETSWIIRSQIQGLFRTPPKTPCQIQMPLHPWSHRGWKQPQRVTGDNLKTKYTFLLCIYGICLWHKHELYKHIIISFAH